MIARLMATVRKYFPVGEDSERMQWRTEMRARQLAAQREIDHLDKVQKSHGPIEDAMFPLEHRKGDRR